MVFWEMLQIPCCRALVRVSCSHVNCKFVQKKKLFIAEKVLSLTEYLKVSEKLNVMQVLSKLTEATTDALFNLPAIVTAQTWTKVAPAYLYSFEHVSKVSGRGSTFLSGLPIVGNAKPSDNTVAHGDELAYLFDARDVFGKQLPNAKSLDDNDKKVRDIFSNLITQFAYLNSGQGVKNKGAFQEFKADQSNFIKIGQEAALGKDFRQVIGIILCLFAFTYFERDFLK